MDSAVIFITEEVLAPKKSQDQENRQSNGGLGVNRRKFLKSSGIMLAGTALPESARAISCSSHGGTHVIGKKEATSLPGHIQVLGLGTGAARIVLAQAEKPIAGVSYGVVDTEIPYCMRDSNSSGLRLEVWPVPPLTRQTPYEEVRDYRHSTLLQQGLQKTRWIQERLLEAEETVFVVCLGSGVTGSVLAHVFINVAQANGIRWSVIATLPFECERQRSRNRAMEQIRKWQGIVDQSRVEVVDDKVLAKNRANGSSLHDAITKYTEVVANHLHRRLRAIT